MMGATHALMGLLLATSGSFFWPELLFPAAVAAFAGGLFPDLDLIHNHRKTLHFPVGYAVLTLILGTLAFLRPSTYTVGGFYFALSAAIHSAIDVFGGGLETKPWIPESEKAIYSHTLGKWFEPKRWIRYDGAPEDLLLSVLIAVPCYLFYTGRLKQLVVVTVVAGGLYTLLRKKIVEWAPDRFL